MTPERAKIERLEEENERLRQRVAALEVDPVCFPASWGLSKFQCVMLSALMKRESCTFEYLRAVAPSTRVEQPARGEAEIVRIQMSKLRVRLRRLGVNVEIKNLWDRGYFLPPESKSVLRRSLTGEE